MARTAPTKKPAATSRKASSPAAKNAQKKAAAPKAAAAKAVRPHYLDERTRRDIRGVVCVVAAIALFVMAVMPTNGLVSSFVADWLHLLLGVGSYILPFVLLIIGASFVVRSPKQPLTGRIAIGLFLIYAAALGLLADFTPNVASTMLSNLFLTANLVSRGGYVGAGMAWTGITLFGQVVTCIILIGLIVVGLIVIGFSLSGFFEHIRSRREEASVQEISPEGSSPTDSDPIGSFVPVASRRRSSGDPELAQAKTRVLGRRAGSDSPSQGKTASLDDAADATALTRKLGKRDEPSSAAKTQKIGSPLATPKPMDGFALPDASLLRVSRGRDGNKESESSLRETAACLQETLEDFKVDADVVGWVAGPTVTLFKVDLPSGVRVNKVTNLEDDIALALAAPGVRIFAPIPGTNYVGIEVPNRVRQNVLLGDVLPAAKAGPLQVAIGKDVEGRSVVSDLSKMPHLLIGGTTGSGKSVAINAMIMSILMRATPSEVRFIMIDPKRVEFTPYNGIPHLYVPVVTEAKEAASALSWGVAEMERRLKVFSKAGARNIGQYNAKVQKGSLEDGDEELPYIVIIIDELADLMMNVGKEVEFSISRLAQLARAAGIHLIVATQRPSTNVVTGLIKANITNRIAFNVASGIDSRVILDTPGAENLIGLGDMLLSKPELAKPQRLQGCFVSEDEINAVVDELKGQGEPEYHSEILKTNLITLGGTQPDGSGGSGGGDGDPLIWEAAEIVVSSKLGSTSNIQRRLKVGYSRAGRIMDELEEKGVVGPPNGSKPREVLVDELELETLKAFERNDAAMES